MTQLRNNIVQKIFGMPNTAIVKFQAGREEKPRYFTEVYWKKFPYYIMGTTKKMLDKIFEKESSTMTKEQTLMRDISKGAFLEELGDRALAAIHLKYPKEEIYKKSLAGSR